MFFLHFAMILLLPTAAMNNGDYFFMLMFPIVVIGACLNIFVTSANGGKMPVKMYEDIVFYVLPSSQHRPMSETTRYPLLCDWIRIGHGRRLKIVSIGDLIVYLGCSLAWIYLGLVILRGLGFL